MINSQIIQFVHSYKIIWYLHDICNFRCEYCIDTLKGLNEFKPPKKIDEMYIRNACQNLLSLGHNNYRFSFFGGETTLYPDLFGLFRTIYDEMSQNITKIMFTSNGSRGIEYFKKFEEFLKYPSFMIRISIHLQHYTDELKKLILFLLENGFTVRIDLLYNLNYKELAFKCLDWLKEIKLKYRNIKQIRFKIVYDSIPFEHFFYPYSKEEIEENKNINITFFNYYQNKTMIDLREKEKYCLLGAGKLFIYQDGTFGYGCSSLKDINNNKSLFFLSKNKFKEEIFKIIKCSSSVPCYHARGRKYNSKKETQDVINKINS